MNSAANISLYTSNPGRLIPVFLDNVRVYLSNGPPRKGPMAAVWDINSRCNARCSFCGYWKASTAGDGKKELNASEKLRIIEELNTAGVSFLSLCSGEPLLSEDIEVLIKEIKRRGIFLNISTNGALLENMADTLVAEGVDLITVSADSHRPEVHDKLRGRKGLFDALSGGIEKVRRSRPKKRPRVVIRHLVSRVNAFELSDFADYWSDRADGVILKPVYSNSATLFGVPRDMEFRPDDEMPFREYYSRILAAHRKLDTPYHRAMPEFIFNEKALRGRYLCFAGTFFGEIDCEGALYACQEMDRGLGGPLGDLKKDSFLSLWGSEEARRMRLALKSGDRCACWVERFEINIRIMNMLKPLDAIAGIFRRRPPGRGRPQA